MKKCPNCNHQTIPYNWIFFGKSKNRNGECYKCTNCEENIIQTNELLIFMIFNNDLANIFVLFSSMTILDQIFSNMFIVIIGSFFLLTLYYSLTNYFRPLKVSSEEKCRGEMSKIGAIFSLIAIPSIIIFTIYVLFFNPNFNKKEKPENKSMTKTLLLKTYSKYLSNKEKK